MFTTLERSEAVGGESKSDIVGAGEMIIGLSFFIDADRSITKRTILLPVKDVVDGIWTITLPSLTLSRTMMMN